jgi:hypothetical protein
MVDLTDCTGCVLACCRIPCLLPVLSTVTSRRSCREMRQATRPRAEILAEHVRAMSAVFGLKQQLQDRYQPQSQSPSST